MRKNSFIQALKFLFFSISAGIIQFGSFVILNEVFPFFNGDYGINYLVALLLSIIWSFTFNRKFTFQATNNIKKAMLLVLLYYAIFTPLSVIIGTHYEKNNVNEYIVLAITMIINFITEFLYNKYIVYRNAN